MKMKKYYKLIAISLLLNVYACNSGDKKEATKKDKVNFVKVITAKKQQNISYIEIVGTIAPNISTEIKSTTDGIIDKLYAVENQYVQKGDIIAIINPNDRVALLANNTQIIKELENKLKKLASDTLLYLKIKKELDEAQKNMAYAQNMYNTVTIISPMNGTVTTKWLNQGSQVQNQEKILTVSNMNSLVIKAEVNEKYFEAITYSKKIAVLLNAYPNDTLTGKISLVYPNIDNTTRTVKFDVTIQNNNKKLLPGMSATLKIPVAIIENSIFIPTDAILTANNDKQFVFTIDTSNIAHKKNIKTGITINNLIQVINGLKPKEKVVIKGQEMLKDSSIVKIIK
mgnify:CR=1 FL=1